MADRPRVSIWRRSFGCGGCLGAIAIGFVGLVVVIALSSDRGGPNPPSSPVQPHSAIPVTDPSTASPAPVLSIAVGDEGILNRPGVAGVWMAVSLEDYQTLVNAEREIDKVDAREKALGRWARGSLSAAGKIKIVRNGTRVRVTDTGSGGLEVEALDGDDSGRSGWVHSWCVSPVPRLTPE